MATTIWQRLEQKLDTLEEKAAKKAEKKAKRQRIAEMVRGMSVWEKIELTMEIWL